jgi:hypothetical protein
MALELIGRHRNAIRQADVRAAIRAVEREICISSFAIGKVRRVKHARVPGTVELKAITPSGLRLIAYAPNVIVEGVGR